MGNFYAYIRVSTQKQGEHGSSLTEQRDAIVLFAQKNGLHIDEWFEEMETAAKQGRGQFTRMMRALRGKKTRGVIFHKIDRGARNLKDWNDIQELIELGCDVRFAQESLDMQTRGGRLTADLLAVISSDFIRNLREEVKKGMRGRLKQGLYPNQAPIGYLDMGGGRAKIPDPERAPLIRQAFELYATGQFNLRCLSEELHRRGLRNRHGNKVPVTKLAVILRNKFYIGLIEQKQSATIYQGIHERLINRALFERVQAVLDGRLSARPIHHDFLFRRLITCAGCHYSLIGERQKGRVYYRCHSPACVGNSIREDAFEAGLKSILAMATLTEEEVSVLLQEARVLTNQWDAQREERRQATELTKQNIAQRLSRLTDALLDGLIDKDIFEEKKKTLYLDRLSADETIIELSGRELYDRMTKFLELGKTLAVSYELANSFEKREILKTATSNFVLSEKKPAVALLSPFSEMANCHLVPLGEPTRNRPRTAPPSLKKLLKLIISHVTSPDAVEHGVK